MSSRNNRHKSRRTAFESRGRYPRLPGTLVPLYWMQDFPPGPPPPPEGMLAVGMGRSYGDVGLLENGKLLHTVALDRFISFDQATGLLRCEAGVTLAEILKFAVPLGWFLPVTPATKYITVGGAIANDIYGRNQSHAGTFGCHLPRFELVRSDGARLECSAASNAEWYAATIGGLGLTGFIAWAEIQLRPIVSRRIDIQITKFAGVEEFIALSEAARDSEYASAWIDCLSQGKNFGRGIFRRGDHSPTPGELKRSRGPWGSLPFDMPGPLVNRYTVEAANNAYFLAHFTKGRSASADYESFLYPLDRVSHGNRVYGASGLLQFQCLLPFEDGNEGILRILKAITSSRAASFAASLQLFGEVVSPGMMSFPAPGITLAVDFPIRADISFDLVERLAYMTAEHRGKMYPAKDAGMTALQFQAFYPQWQEFARYIDPAFSSSFWRRVTRSANGGNGHV
jgi:FAD/FMN-containing dehydrogenase